LRLENPTQYGTLAMGVLPFGFTFLASWLFKGVLHRMTLKGMSEVYSRLLPSTLKVGMRLETTRKAILMRIKNGTTGGTEMAVSQVAFGSQLGLPSEPKGTPG